MKNEVKYIISRQQTQGLLDYILNSSCQMPVRVAVELTDMLQRLPIFVEAEPEPNVPDTDKKEENLKKEVENARNDSAK